MQGIRKFFVLLTPPVIIAAALIIAVVIVGVVFVELRSKPAIAWSTAELGSITQMVTASGSVEPTESIDLGFQRSGTIARIPVKVGDHVVQGQTLATLQAADLAAAREQASANLAAAQAKLTQLQAGTRPEALATARQSVAADIQAGYIAADDAIHNKLDQFITGVNTTSPSLTFPTSDQNLQNTLLSGRVTIGQVLLEFNGQRVSGDASSYTDLSVKAQTAEHDLTAVEQLLDTANAVLTTAIANGTVSASTIAGYQTSINTARTNVSAALSALTTAAGTLSLDEAGSTSEDIAAQQAAVDAAQAALDAAQATLAQTVITAPISGVITRQDDNVGEVAVPGSSFISLNSDARFELKAYVSQADVGKIHVGDQATVDLDAYPNVDFKASVVSIDPAATVQNGVPSYLITVQFTDQDPRIKAGLTGNLTIMTTTASSALLVPASAIITKGSQTFVLKDINGAQTLVPVQVGIINAGGNAQIISGLSAGDHIASFGAVAE